MDINYSNPLQLLYLSIISNKESQKENNNLRKKAIYKNNFYLFQNKAIHALNKLRYTISDDNFMIVALKYRDILIANNYSNSEIQELFSEYF